MFSQFTGTTAFRLDLRHTFRPDRNQNNPSMIYRTTVSWKHRVRMVSPGAVPLPVGGVSEHVQSEQVTLRSCEDGSDRMNR